MSTYADVKARCARIVTRLEAIATDPNATPADPRDLFIRLELLSYEMRGATFRVRECWWPASNARRSAVTLRSRQQCGLEDAKREAETAPRELPS
jgi:hypothetical protein